mmetsp:Transcript_9785/g.26606  ORF Transcript_9785/g.26606 Transcript_9785/m.26606 type:complete len:230 (+) Transcript_9785:476-1165(+)
MLPVHDGLALLEKHNLLSLGHARLYVNRQRILLPLQPHVIALFALLHRRLLEHPGAYLSCDHLLLAVALPLSRRGLQHVLVPRHMDLFADVQVLQGHVDADVHVLTLWRLLLLEPATKWEPTKPAKELAEYVARVRVSTLTHVVQALFPVSVVNLSFLRVREHLVCVRYLGKLLGGGLLLVLIALHLIGMQLKGQLPVRAFDHGIIRSLVHVEQVIKTLLGKRNGDAGQ